jgi:alpha-ribazole phosphatase
MPEACCGSGSSGYLKACLWVARHAPVRDSTICYGRADVEVSMAPDVAAACLLESYRGAPPDYLWSSPATRCRLVAERLATAWRASVEIEEALAELDFGDWEGRPWTTIATDERHSYLTWLGDWQRIPPPNGERPLDIEARVRRWLSRLAPGSTHALVAHTGIVRALHVLIEKCSWPEAMGRTVRHLSWVGFPSYTAA